MPNEEQALAVLDALAQSPDGLSITALEARSVAPLHPGASAEGAGR